jgi:hypothetical protein
VVVLVDQLGGNGFLNDTAKETGAHTHPPSDFPSRKPDFPKRRPSSS